MRIVYIDDDADDREFFIDAITIIDPQISCITFDSADDALGFLKMKELTADFVFVDINMPRVNGYESVREIRSVANLRTVPIIMLTTSYSPTDITDFDGVGIRILKKANRMEDLVQAIKNIFRQAGQLEEKP